MRWACRTAIRPLPCWLAHGTGWRWTGGPMGGWRRGREAAGEALGIWGHGANGRAHHIFLEVVGGREWLGATGVEGRVSARGAGCRRRCHHTLFSLACHLAIVLDLTADCGSCAAGESCELLAGRILQRMVNGESWENPRRWGPLFLGAGQAGFSGWQSVRSRGDARLIYALGRAICRGDELIVLVTGLSNGAWRCRWVECRMVVS